MSLVGSLEDLGLGDILQIVSLSQKSGLLLLRSDTGEGRIVFRDGLVRAAFVKGEPEDLRALVVGGGFVPPADFERAAERARAGGVPLAGALAEHAGLPLERLDSLRRECVERAVFQMFGWRTGEFSFEVREELDPRDEELLLPTGIHAQYVMMEATRLRDERSASGADGEADEALVFSGEETPAPDAGVSEAAQERAAPVTRLVVIDPDLDALEWLKEAAAPLFERIHIFQRSEGGVVRIRQYLGRGELPAVLVSAHALPDPITGAESVDELVLRLRALALHMPIVVIHGESDAVSGNVRAADAFVRRPPRQHLTERQAWSRLEPFAAKLRDELRRCLERRPVRSSDPDGEASAVLRRLKEMSDRLRAPSARGVVLSLVLDFAAEIFSRVAMFMIRDDVAVGVAQRGLGNAGGPEEEAFRRIEFPADEPGSFRSVLESRSPFRGRLTAPGDDGLVARLGGEAPAEAYLAPIESGEHPVALLYADNLPGTRPLGDTTVLEIVLHEAGLALDRTVLERALASSD